MAAFVSVWAALPPSMISAFPDSFLSLLSSLCLEDGVSLHLSFYQQAAHAQRLRALVAGRRGLCSRPQGDKEGGQKCPILVPALGLLVFVTLAKSLPAAGPGSPGVGLGELR